MGTFELELSKHVSYTILVADICDARVSAATIAKPDLQRTANHAYNG